MVGTLPFGLRARNSGRRWWPAFRSSAMRSWGIPSSTSALAMGVALDMGCQ